MDQQNSDQPQPEDTANKISTPWPRPGEAKAESPTEQTQVSDPGQMQPDIPMIGSANQAVQTITPGVQEEASAPVSPPVPVQPAEVAQPTNNLNVVVAQAQEAKQSAPVQEQIQQQPEGPKEGATEEKKDELPPINSDADLLAQVATPAKKKHKQGGGGGVLKMIGYLFICALVCGGIFAAIMVLGLKAVYDEYPNIQQTAFDACVNSKADVSTPGMIVGDVEKIIAFPTAFACDQLKTDGIIELITAGQFISISINNNETTGEFTFNNGDEDITLQMTKNEDKWIITGVKRAEGAA